MYPTPILWLEIGIAATLGVAFLWTHPEWSVFLYGLALGFPDLAMPLGGTINVRLDDVLILLLLARSILWQPVAASRGQKNILMWQALFLAVCMLSAAVETASGAPPPGYETAKMAGCAVILLALPRLVQSDETAALFRRGPGLRRDRAGRSDASASRRKLRSNSYANFQQLKSAATFDTWNPNTIGQAAILLVFAAALGAIVFAKTLRHGAILWAALAAGFCAPARFRVCPRHQPEYCCGFHCVSLHHAKVEVAADICRGMSVRRAVSALRAIPELMREATQINVATGRGVQPPIRSLGHGFSSDSKRSLARAGIRAGNCLSNASRKRGPRARRVSGGLAGAGSGRPVDSARNLVPVCSLRMVTLQNSGRPRLWSRDSVSNLRAMSGQRWAANVVLGKTADDRVIAGRGVGWDLSARRTSPRRKRSLCFSR